jgi:predicted nucleic acid-binding protein
MKRAVLWDSSAVLALLDADDADRGAAREIALRLARERRRSFLTNNVEVETHALLLRKLGRAIARQWLLAGSLPTVRIAGGGSARELIASYSDKDWSLCDAISFAVIEKRRVASAFSFDRHFRQFGGCAILGADEA